jgi:hypothetical protein
MAALSTRQQIVASLFKEGSPNGDLVRRTQSKVISLNCVADRPPQGARTSTFLCYSSVVSLGTRAQVPLPPNAAPTTETSKPRYMLLAVTPDAKVKLFKTKRNSNGSFSIGKVWGLEELQALEVARVRLSSWQFLDVIAVYSPRHSPSPSIPSRTSGKPSRRRNRSTFSSPSSAAFAILQAAARSASSASKSCQSVRVPHRPTSCQVSAPAGRSRRRRPAARSAWRLGYQRTAVLKVTSR